MPNSRKVSFFIPMAYPIPFFYNLPFAKDGTLWWSRFLHGKLGGVNQFGKFTFIEMNF